MFKVDMPEHPPNRKFRTLVHTFLGNENIIIITVDLDIVDVVCICHVFGAVIVIIIHIVKYLFIISSPLIIRAVP